MKETKINLTENESGELKALTVGTWETFDGVGGLVNKAEGRRSLNYEIKKDLTVVFENGFELSEIDMQYLFGAYEYAKKYYAKE